ncbi:MULTISPECIES: DUF4365 domain-containing protein [unclassified Fibrobacter]|uniref:DUF4365 domain-containing protein n=1 Tax=unclassified Fibrobacter TaxID=2634177 RepID=UPI0009188114|nr:MULTISPECIES: DUF4365 domain-containing protein [unclassified Fibrobacter]OWV06997.1 hypothetical protein B7993_04350 [Fibrobacter sp. UWH3]SHK24812.1 protein of unknown function [Fibrobacter sp. UWH6]
MLPQRTAQHISDTKALRLIISKIPDKWIVRNLEERDYGIDLTLELFENDPLNAGKQRPKGQYVLLQVKGAEKKFSPKNGLCKFYSFKTATLGYANLFNIPMFLVYVTHLDQKIHYVWLQKYIEKRLRGTDWGLVEKVNIDVPEENDLCTDNGQNKFEALVEQDYREKEANEVMKKFFFLNQLMYGSFRTLDKKDLMDAWIDFLETALTLQYFDDYDSFTTYADIDDLEKDALDISGLLNFCKKVKRRRKALLENEHLLLGGCLKKLAEITDLALSAYQQNFKFSF